MLRIINEPTAAALAYGFGKTINGKIAVFDLGGGTFDISVLEVGNGVFDVIATGGDTYLGGEDFDNRIIDWLVVDFAKEHGIDLRKDRMALQRLKDAAEKAKIELSTAKETQINLPFICTPPGGGAALHLQKTLTREQLEDAARDLVERTVDICEQVLGRGEGEARRPEGDDPGGRHDAHARGAGGGEGVLPPRPLQGRAPRRGGGAGRRGPGRGA